ncbi:reverse transcriptase domain-containing protein [Tanacetum coccineum]
MDNTISVSPIPTLRIHKDHPKGQILGDPTSAVQTRGKIQKASSVQQALTISQALKDESWVEAMQEELLQFKLQQVWILIDLPFGKKAFGTKQEEGINYDEVFAPVARIETIKLFLAFASYMRFIVYQMDVKSEASSILLLCSPTWDDLVAKFINQFFPPSKTTNLRNEITNFKQRFDESFSEAWDRFKDLLRACPHHGFSELHQLDTFYNALNVNDQDSLNSAAGGNFLDKRPADCSSIIESKSKVRHSRSKSIVAKVSAALSTTGVSPRGC